MKTLRDVKIGETVTVKKLHGEGAIKRRIMDMGITKGAEVYVRKVGLLKSGGYLVSDELGHLSLTESGVEVAAKIYERHTLLTRYLEMLGVGAETAAEDACKMEHIISDESFLAIKQHVAAMEKMRPAD